MRSVHSFRRQSAAARRGVTLTEMIVILTIVGVIMAFLMPTLRKTFTSNTRHSAGREARSYLYRAQATAVQFSRRSWLIRSGNTLKVLVDSSGTVVQRGATMDVNKAFGATLTETPNDTILFDPRGFPLLNGTTPRLIVTVGASTAADTVCITGLSQILAKGCP